MPLTNPLVEPVGADGLYPTPRPLSYGEAKYELNQYEGRSARLTVAAGWARCVPFVVVPPAVLAVSVFAAPGGVAAYAIGLVSLCTAWLPGWAYRRRLWERPVLKRVVWRLSYDPRVPTVSVIVQENDEKTAWRAIHKAGLIELHTTRRAHIGSDPRTSQIAIAQWAARPQLDDYAFRDVVCEMLRAAGIWANVGGVEIGTPPSLEPAAALAEGMHMPTE